MNLVLIGYRGTGKTVVSQELAKRLGRIRIGMDETLVQRFGESIPEFVQKNGWDAFRDAESDLARELGGREDLVIDCGGGVVVRDQNLETLKANGRVAWLKASVETIAGRISGDTQRPSLTGQKTFIEEIEEVLTQRLPLYQKGSDFAVDTDSLSVEEVAERIQAWWDTV